MAARRIPEFFRFCLVGLLGFLTDAGFLELFVHLGLDARFARLLSVLVALHVTYLCHGLFTFRDHNGFTRRRWLQFLATNAFGALLNYCTFLAVLTCVAVANPFLHRQLALLTGTALALGFNYWANRYVVFKRSH